MSPLRELILGVVIVGAVFVGLLYGTASLVFYQHRVSCSIVGQATSLEIKMIGNKWTHGCFILVDGKWIDVDNYGMGFTQ